MLNKFNESSRLTVFPLKVLFLASSFNGLTQKLWCSLRHTFKETQLMLGIHPQTIHHYHPDLILCPFLKEYIPDAVWQQYPCLVVHPGPMDDGGPSSLNWAVLEGRSTWGVTILQANAEWDAGSVWASKSFELPEEAVSFIYRNQVSDLALELIPQAIERFYSGATPLPKPAMNYKRRIRHDDLRFSWEEDTHRILRAIRAGDSQPGTLGMIDQTLFHLFGARKGELRGTPGNILEEQWGDICIATGDGSVWIARMALPGGVKIRSAYLLGEVFPEISHKQSAPRQNAP
ncbi:MAG: hypothetical protein HQM12_21875 [SAR324 cluster bacterium]|nr:hypothetical protein [SAR324 cluster bacterium]